MQPDQYRHPPTTEAIENFGKIIEDYYAFIDTAVGQLLKKQPADVTIFIVSDHGMYAVNQDQFFNPDDPPKNVISPIMEMHLHESSFPQGAIFSRSQSPHRFL